MSLSNSDIAELLALEAEGARDHLKRAYKKAARAALQWPMECTELWQTGRSLTEQARIGPFLAKRIEKWLAEPLAKLEEDPIRADFMSQPEVRRLLNGRPLWRSRCNGDLQMHSEWSDGSSAIKDLGDAGIERGYRYIAVTDHSKGLAIAGGIDEAALERQAAEIGALNKKYAKAGRNFRILQSIEMNLSPDGLGDMDPEALSKLDLVVGAFHSKLRGTGDQTERYVKALANPDIQILAHPRGRIYNHRLGLIADWPLVFVAAKHFGKAVEIDGYPDRQDLNRELLKQAKMAGVYISMGSDAHNASQLEFLDYSLAAALSAGIPARRILNFMTLEKLRAWVKNVRLKATGDSAV